VTRCLVLLVCLASLARADALHATSDAPLPGRHLVYGELLGKGGVYGLGYEYTLMPWLAVGAAGSYVVVEDQRLITLAPYLHLPILGRGHHRMFTELGAIVSQRRIPSPVPDWNGTVRTGTGGFLSLGYEHAGRRLVMRASGSVVAGDGGLGPMVGFSIGARP
jgi:hypothetical protein